MRMPRLTSLLCLLITALPMLVATECYGQNSSQSKRKGASKSVARFAWVNALSKKAHPRLQHQTFESELASGPVGYVTLLPLNYASTSKAYPVVYHLHGGRPGSETKATGIASDIASASRGRDLDEIIHVFVNGGPVSHYNVPTDPAINQVASRGADVFITELIPHIDQTYRTIRSRQGRGLTGFSQGGRGTMRLSLRYPDLFCCAAAGGGGYASEKRISEENGFENPKLRFAKGDNAWDLAKAYAHSDQPRVDYLIYVGTKGFNYSNNLDYMRYLTSLDIPHQSLIVRGVPHSNREIYARHASDLLTFFAEHFESLAGDQAN